MYIQHLVRLVTLLPPRSGPALLSAGVQERWQDEMARKDWYEQGKQYWAQSDVSNAGVLSGLELIHDSDIEDSFDFLTRQPFGDNGAPLWPLPEQPIDTVLRWTLERGLAVYPAPFCGGFAAASTWSTAASNLWSTRKRPSGKSRLLRAVAA